MSESNKHRDLATDLLEWAIPGAMAWEMGTLDHLEKMIEMHVESYAAEHRKSDESQLVWLRDWAQKVFCVDTNTLIGQNGWPRTISEVIARLVEERLAAQKVPPDSINEEEEWPLLALRCEGCGYKGDESEFLPISAGIQPQTCPRCGGSSCVHEPW